MVSRRPRSEGRQRGGSTRWTERGAAAASALTWDGVGVEELPADGDRCSRGGVGAAHGPRRKISESTEASPSPETGSGVCKGRSMALGTVR